ncbi:MAG: hypothetical protein E7343_00015 [Clostridiales bacterium]|nr:hypothetical protein [Clostridiales bacterium]
MLAKWKIELVSFLSSLSLVSVGFSAWNLSSSIPVIETVDGTVQTDYVIKTDDYISLDSITVPEYNESGFIIQDSNADGGFTASNYSLITLKFTVKIEPFKKDTSPFTLNGDEYLQIYCDISFADKQIDASTLFTFSYITSTPKYKITSDSESSVLHIYNYPISTITNATEDYQLITTIKIETDKSQQTLINDILKENEFIFNTRIYGTQEEVEI